MQSVQGRRRLTAGSQVALGRSSGMAGIGLLVTALAAMLCVWAGAARANTPDSFADLAEEMLPKVVSISTSQVVGGGGTAEAPQIPPGTPFEDLFRDFFNNNPRGNGDSQRRRAAAFGSGFIIDPSGYIVTNNHVIDGADEITVILHDDSRFPAKIIGRDDKTDIALLKIESDKPLPAIRWGDSNKARIGDWVLAIGGIGFAVPSAIVQRVVTQLREFGRTKRGWLGVRIQTVTDEIADNLGLDKAQGALIASITKDGPAEAAKIEPGDVVLTFDGKPVESMRELPRIVAETPIDKKVPLEVWRKGKKVTLHVVIGELEESGVEAASVKPDAPTPDAGQTEIDEIGLTVTGITDALREEYGLPAELRGVLITGVSASGGAAEKGLRPGDVVVEVGQEEVRTPAEIAAKVTEARDSGRKSVLLLVNRKGDLRFFAVRI
mgnify:CR=1 FL=1